MQVILPTIGPTRTEPGCIRCDLFQSMDDDMKLVLTEEWNSPADLERHIRSDQYSKVLAWVEMSLVPPEIRFDTVAGSQGLEWVEAVRG